MMPRCATCRHWWQLAYHLREDLPFGKCHHPAVVVDTEWKSADDLRSHTGSVLLNDEEWTPEFETGRDFGCVHHEPREEGE